MVEIKFLIDGKPVNPDQTGNALEKAILKQVTKNIFSALQSIKCDQHERHPVVTVEGKSLNALSFKVAGCCQTLIDQSIAKLKYWANKSLQPTPRTARRG